MGSTIHPGRFASAMLLAAGFGLAVFAGAAAAQEQQMEWQFSESNEPENKGALTARLIYGVPETDNVQVSAVCDGRASTGAKFAAFMFAAHIDMEMQRGTPVDLRFSGGGFEHTVKGAAHLPQSEEDVSGVTLDLELDDPLWKAMQDKARLDYLVPGYRANTLDFSRGRDAIRSFHETCRAYAEAILGKGGEEDAAEGSRARSSSDAAEREKEAFSSAKELGTLEAWDAFLTAYPDGFYADLARAYVKRLGDAPSKASEAAKPETKTRPAMRVRAVHNGPGTAPWENMTVPFIANSSRPAYAAAVDAGGVQLTAFCHAGKDGHFVVPGLRVTGADPDVSERLRQGLAAAPTVGGELSRIDMEFSDGTVIDGVSATSLKSDEVTLYFDRKLPTPRDEVLEQMMAGSMVSLSAPPFSASFQLDGSRGAICSMLNRCGANIPACGGSASSSSRDESGQDGRVNCGRGRTWVGAQGKCVCVDSNRRWDGKRCVRRRPKTNTPTCTGGRTFDRQVGRCVCNGDSAWNGRACVKENEPPRRRPNTTSCTGGRTFDRQVGRCVCNGDSAWNGRACVKENEPPSGGQNNNNSAAQQAACGALQIACSLGQKKACNSFNQNCR